MTADAIGGGRCKMTKHPLLTRDKAIAALVEVFALYFGSEECSAEMYQAFAEDLHLCLPWDGESTTPEYLPPSMWELLAAAGIDPDHITAACGINPIIADDLKEAGYQQLRPEGRSLREGENHSPILDASAD